MNKDPSIVRKTESAIDDLLDLARRRPWVCAIVVAVIVVPVAFSLYLQFISVPHLKSSLGDKRDEIQKLESSLQRVEKERDKAEIRLAPFLATANQSFSNAPPDKRLDLLLAMMDEVMKTVQVAAHVLTARRRIPDDIVLKTVAQLKSSPHLTVEIHALLGNAETLGLAQQLKSVFVEAGWPIAEGGIQQSVYTEPQRGCQFIFPTKPSPDLQATLLALVTSLGQERRLFLNPEQSKDMLKVIVGEK